MSLAPLLLILVAGQAPSSGSVFHPASRPYEVLRPDVAWCGPRVLYFFACYYDEECTLDKVVELCRSDADGYTTLLDLTRAARELGLEPTPVKSNVKDLLALGGPAIIGVGRPNTLGGVERRLHFIGVVGRQGDALLVIDPAISVEPFLASPSRLASSYAGYAVLLRGCPRPLAWPTHTVSLTALGLTAAASLGVVIMRIRRHRSPDPTGAPPCPLPAPESSSCQP